MFENFSLVFENKIQFEIIVKDDEFNKKREKAKEVIDHVTSINHLCRTWIIKSVSSKVNYIDDDDYCCCCCCYYYYCWPVQVSTSIDHDLVTMTPNKCVDMDNYYPKWAIVLILDHHHWWQFMHTISLLFCQQLVRVHLFVWVYTKLGPWLIVRILFLELAYSTQFSARSRY